MILVKQETSVLENPEGGLGYTGQLVAAELVGPVT